MRANITEATGALSDLRTRMEQNYNDSRSYAVAGVCAVGSAATNELARLNALANTKWQYACALPGPNVGQAFTVTATGQLTMVGFAFTINQIDARSTTAMPAFWGSSALPLAYWATSSGN